MTGRRAPETSIRSTLGTLADATLEVIDQLSAGDLLAAVTPERLGQATGYAPSSIRYQLSRLHRDVEVDSANGVIARTPPGRTRWSFDREQLMLLALDALTAVQIRHAEALSGTYLESLATLERTGDLTALGLAIKANLDAFTPGASDHNSGATERVWSVALAAADGSTEIARRLRFAQDEQIVRYLPVHEMALKITGRTLRGGVTLMALAKQVNIFIEGVATRRRFEPAFDERHVMSSVLSIFYGLTRPLADPEMPSPADILAAAGRRGN